MSRLLAMAVLAAALLTASPAQSGPPSPWNSSVDPVLLGSPEGTHSYRVVVRNVNGSPLAGRPVVLDFSATTIRLTSIQEAGVTLDCAQRTLTKSTGNDGLAAFHLRFAGSVNDGLIPVSCTGVLLATVSARSTDLDAKDGRVGIGDFAIFAPLFLDGSRAHPEADFDLSGGPIDLGDFAILAADYLAGGQGAYCP